MPGSIRNFVGYRRGPPRFEWPGGKRMALSLVVTDEEGGENCVLDGDESSECRPAKNVLAGIERVHPV